MARKKNKTGRQLPKSICKTCFALGAVLLLWVALLISPLGRVVAAVTIFGLIVVLFILGFVNVQEDDV